MTLRDLIRWAWANDRGAFLLPVLLPASILMWALALEIIVETTP